MGRKDQVMARVTDRYYCLGCGRFWRMPNFEIVPGTHFCPYCGDMYWGDNVQPNQPPPLYEEHEMNTPCFHHMVVECLGDVKFCTICGTDLAVVFEGKTQKQWQLGLLERLGV